MNKNILILFCFLLVNVQLPSQVYSNKIVYSYNYTVKTTSCTNSGILYLGCQGRKLPICDTNQFAITWTEELDVLNKKFISTGIIENSNRIWMHPPRLGKFKILEYSPFPEIKFPTYVGKSWIWELTPGSNWINLKYDVDSTDVLIYNYTITNKVAIKTKFTTKPIDCYEVTAISKNEKFKTKFIGLFNIYYGFINMSFYNIDGSTISLELTSINSYSYFNKAESLFTIENKYNSQY